MRGMIASLLILLGLASASAEEPPEGLAAALTARDYEKALEVARGASTEPERLKDIETLAAAKKRIIDSAAAKKRLPVTVEVAGQSVRGTLVAADQSGYSVEALGVAQARSWKEMSSDVFYLTARRCFDDSSGADHLTLARACAALGLAERGESELQAATRADAGLASEAAALRKRLAASAPAGAAEEGGPAPGPAPGPRRPSAEAAKGVPTGYESGLAARLLQEEDRRRIAAIPLQDLIDKAKGRYTQVSDDGVMGYWGLDAVRARQDAAGKPYAELLKGGAYQTERVLFADLGTGVTTMKLTNEPYGAGDEILYFGKAGFSSDGSLMVWQRSQKPSLWGPGGQTTTDTHGPILLDSDGTRPRIAFRDKPSVSIPVCSPTNPDLAYSMAGAELVELNLRTGKVQRTIASGVPRWWLKISPDGKYACNVGYGGREIAVVALDSGQTWKVPLTGAIHDSYRFVPGDTEWLMYWYEGGGLRNNGIALTNFKTGQTTKYAKVYFDWNHGDVGRFVGFHCEGTVLPWDNAQKTWLPKENLFHPDRNFDDTGPYYDNPVSSNGYAQHWPDDELWAYPTRITERPYLSEIEAVFAKPFKEGGRANRFRVCFTNLMRGKDRKGRETIVLDRPNVSPDGTKMLYNSNVFGLVEVYMTEIRKPRPPVNIKAEWTGGGVRVSWEPPKYRAEIGGYLVYRSDESGRGFAPLTAEPVAAAEYVDRTAEAGRAHFYAVRSVERSRLESGLSAEAAAASDKKLIDSAPLRLFAEAEDAIPAGLDASPPDGLWLNVDGFASNLYYLWQRRSDRPGAVELEVDAPRAGSYWVLARVKGREGAAFQVAGSAVQCGASESWQWAKSAGQASLRAGRQKIQMASSKYGSCIDCLYLSTDGSFEPKGRISAVEPEAPKLTAQADAQGCVRLSWSGKKDARWLCWNLYCGGQAGLPCSRKTLFASHDAEEYLDWQAPAGAKYYRATQLTLDGLESKPSNEVELK